MSTTIEKPEVGPVERLHIAVVSGGEEVLWVGAAASRSELADSLADFLLPRCLYQLCDPDARQFRRLVDQGQKERAVELYFAAIGDRWERERLAVVTRDLVRHERTGIPTLVR